METNSQPTTPTSTSHSSGNMIWVVLGVLLIIAALGYFLYSRSNSAQTGTQQTQMEQSTTESGTATSGTSATENSAADSNTVNTMEATDTASAENVKEFKVTGSPFKFDPSSITVKKGDTVRIVFTNAEGFHDWVLDEFNARTKQLQAGQSETIEFVADKVGEFEYYCSVGNHRAQGMVGTLTVTE